MSDLHQQSRLLKNRFPLLAVSLGAPFLILIVLTLWVLDKDERMVHADAVDHAAHIADLLLPTLNPVWNGTGELDDIAREIGGRLRSFARERGHTIHALSEDGSPISVISPILDELILNWPDAMYGLVHHSGLHLSPDFKLSKIGTKRSDMRPGAYPTTPVPPLQPLKELTDDQLTLWHSLNTQLARHDEENLSFQNFEFIENSLPANLSHPFLLDLAERYESQGNRESALEIYQALTKSQEINPETGLPIAPVAAWRVFQSEFKLWHEAQGSNVDTNLARKKVTSLFQDLESVLVRNPSILTPVYLEKAFQKIESIGMNRDLAKLVNRWPADEGSREFVRYLAEHYKDMWDLETQSHAAWVRWKDLNWLVLALPKTYLSDNQGSFLRVWQEDIVREAIYRKLVNFPLHVPDYASVEISLLDKRILEMHFKEDRGYPSEPTYPYYQGNTPNILLKSRRAANANHETLSSRTFTMHLFGGQKGTLRILLTHPDVLYRQHQLRVTLYIGILFLAAAVMGVGLYVLRKTLLQQEALAQNQINYISSVSHELRAPVAAIQILTESLRDKRVTAQETISKYYHDIIGECHRLGRHVDQVLDFARLEQGKTSLDLTPVNVAVVMEDVSRSLLPLADEKKLRIQIDSNPDTANENNAQWLLDEKGISQVLRNLLDNAIKHSPTHASIEMGWERVSDHELLLYVQDHGPGVSSQESQRIFNRFYRVGSELTRETPGTGIGLHLVKQIVDQHHGRIRVRDTPGGGARFEVILPRIEQSQRTNE